MPDVQNWPWAWIAIGLLLVLIALFVFTRTGWLRDLLARARAQPTAAPTAVISTVSATTRVTPDGGTYQSRPPPDDVIPKLTTPSGWPRDVTINGCTVRCNNLGEFAEYASVLKTHTP